MFSPDSITKKKRSGNRLLQREIEFIVDGYTAGTISDDEMIRREIIRKKNIRESNGKFGMKNYLPDSRKRMSVASDAELFPMLETVVYN